MPRSSYRGGPFGVAERLAFGSYWPRIVKVLQRGHHGLWMSQLSSAAPEHIGTAAVKAPCAAIKIGQLRTPACTF